MNLFTGKNVKRIVALLCVLMTISAFIMVPSYANPDENAFYEPDMTDAMYGVIDATDLEVREGASEEAPVIATVSKYTYVSVFWIEGDWVCISPKDDGVIGYVPSKDIKLYAGVKPEGSAAAGKPAVDLAAQFLGVPYVWGGTSPSGFDCSGLMYYVYKQLGYKLYRVANDQMKNGIAVSYEDLAPGDLVGFTSSPGGSHVSHIGMYVGDGQMIHAPHTGDVVRYANIGPGTYYHKRFAGGRRIIY